ncbi:hypothetical protein LQW54_010280 [Pestalotiopsis sp. IQ-011]
MDWGGTGDVRYNNRRYHALADEYPIYSERYDANESRIFERASRPSCKRSKNPDLKTALDVDKRLNPTTYRDNDPGHELAVQWWINKAAVWKKRIEALEAWNRTEDAPRGFWRLIPRTHESK